MDKKLEVNINYCDKDIKQAISYIIIRINKIWVGFVCFSGVILSMLIYGFINGFSSYLKGQTIVFTVCGFLFYAIYYQIPVNGYVDFYRKRKGGIYTFSDHDIKIVGEEVQSICAWGIFKKGYDIHNSFLLRDENKFLYIFPKRCFDNEADIEMLRQVMSENIKDYKVCK
ncbi:hypothetical protein DFR58_1365 [Anaerobacterium chartisolvens]|uniref:Uncharacterized protein n=1 Tax=Anaerobacterium chartisolvens TaxID=1297424 RepID=A0A369AIV5_9FIRM|nr:YcxB family protein [Anaerobacterium chartisolvens]RCX09329.1 hypothetical protein DFR58_1365 [Anaerobacterium chartisolvens]